MIKGKLFEASTASSQINVPRFKQSFLFLEEDVVKKKSGNQSFWLHGRVTATLISHAIQGELKIDLYSLPASCLSVQRCMCMCRIKLLPSINHALYHFIHWTKSP